MSDEAQKLAVAANNQFETLMANGGDLADLRDRASKALENACRIAGVLTVIERGLAARTVEVEYLKRGLVLIQWYLSEALRIRGMATAPQVVLDAELLMAWLKNLGLKQFRSKKVLNAGPNQLRDKERLTAAISLLVLNGYLAENEPGKIIDGVKPRKSWRVLHHVV